MSRPEPPRLLRPALQQSQRAAQTLAITPQLRQAIQLLQFSNTELDSWIEDQLAGNPLLARTEQHEDSFESPASLLPGSDDGSEPPASREPRLAQANQRWHENAAGDPWHGAAQEAGVGADRYGHGDLVRWPGTEPWDAGETAAQPSLRLHLLNQAAIFLQTDAEQTAAATLVALLDDSGYLPADDQQVSRTLGWSAAEYARLLEKLQMIEPVGVFARSLRECLALQLRDRDRLDPAMMTLLDNLDLLASGERAQLRQLCGVDDKDFAAMIAELRSLNPRPAAAFDKEQPSLRFADAILHVAADGHWTVELNAETLPHVHVNRRYAASLMSKSPRRSGADDTQRYVRARLGEASWLVRVLKQRARTILAVARAIMARQQRFIEHGIAYLQPLILQDIAGEVGLHESTVSRAIANKCIETPRGTLDLRFFFSSALPGADGSLHAAESVRRRIVALVGHETRPLSDEAIVAALGREGLDVARRTVAKYRESLRIPSSQERRRLKALGLR